MFIALLAAVLLQDVGQAASDAPSDAASDAAMAAAQGVAGSDQPFRCVRDGSTPEVNACLTDDLEREEARMQRYLTAAEQRARASDEQPRAFGGPSAQRGYLAASQAVWTAYARIVCEGVDDSWKDGSIHTAMYLGCMIDMTHERTSVIWRDHLTYMDSTPPVLPEPVTPAVRRRPRPAGVSGSTPRPAASAPAGSTRRRSSGADDVQPGSGGRCLLALAVSTFSCQHDAVL